MARSHVTTQEIGINSGALITWTAADATNDHSYYADGKTVFLIKNGSGGSINVDVDSVADPKTGRTGDIALEVTNGNIGIIPPIQPQLFAQRSGDYIGKVQVNIDADTTSYVAAVRFTRI